MKLNWRNRRIAFSILATAVLVLPVVSTVRADTPAVVASGDSIQHVDIGAVDSISSIRTAPDGNLVVLAVADKAFKLLVVTPDGKLSATVPVPADVSMTGFDPSRFSAMQDAEGNFYVARDGDHQIWTFGRDGSSPKAIDLGMDTFAWSIVKYADGEFLTAFGAASDAEGVRLHLPDLAKEARNLSGAPSATQLTRLHVRDDGDVYLFSPEQLIWHFGADGKFIEKIGGAGPVPPRPAMPGGFTSAFFDVAQNGDVYWTAGDYGQIIKISADGKQALRYKGMDPKGQPWTAPLHQMTGLAISGDRAYVVGGNKLTSFPLSTLKPDGENVQAADPRGFGLDFHLTSTTPYKTFLTADANLELVVAGGNRITHQAVLNYTLFDIAQNDVAHGSQPLPLPGETEVKIAYPKIELPALGWYRLDTSICLEDGSVLTQQSNMLCRTFDDATLPIPEKEVSGWNDLQTHRMLGMGLHRFGSNNHLKDLPNFAPGVQYANENHIPYYFQLTDKPDVTPENVEVILKMYPGIPLLEIMNEPDQQGVTPEDYVEKYLKPCYEAAHRIQPNIKILGPAKCGIDMSWMERFFKAGGANYVDIVSVHTYERNNSMDVYHWSWKLPALKKMMSENGAGEKPLYQTEHGFLGNYHTFVFRPQWQARSLLEEYAVCDQCGIGPDKFMYYYVNEGGYAGFSAELVNGQREIYPAGLMMRTRAHMLNGKQFAQTLGFGEVGDKLVVGSRYNGGDSDVISLINTGVYQNVDVAAALPADAKVFDCFGNASSIANGSISVGMYPLYVVIPHGATAELKLPWSGKNIAPAATFEIDDADAKASIDKLTNGIFEFDFADEPERKGMVASPNKLPLDLTATWPAPQTIDHVILYGTLADNQFCSPLDYDLEARVDGAWQKLDQVRVPTEVSLLKAGNINRITSYANPWVFMHQFKAVRADAIRFHFTRATYGQFPTKELYEDLVRAQHWGPLPPAVQLRELQVFSPEQ